MKNPHSAFTLIELLVVITIIAILASIALPVFNGVTERANQTKDLSNAKQIGLALKLFASDNNGAFPSKGPAADYNSGTDLTAATFPTMLLVAFPSSRARILARPAQVVPDNTIDPRFLHRTDTLKRVYAYVSDYGYDQPFSLLADGFSDRPCLRLTNRTKAVFGRRKALIFATKADL
jgi:prepilin-type N-terminal cleavage/methylation domain-containing protein